MTTCAPDVRSKEITCDIQKNRMKLSVRGDTVAAGEFYAPVDSSESIWELGERPTSVQDNKAFVAFCCDFGASDEALLDDKNAVNGR